MRGSLGPSACAQASFAFQMILILPWTMNLLLDTSAFLWLLTNDGRLPARIKEMIRDPEHEVWLSVVSLWEIQVKYQLRKLPLPEPPAATSLVSSPGTGSQPCR